MCTEGGHENDETLVNVDVLVQKRRGASAVRREMHERLVEVDGAGSNMSTTVHFFMISAANISARSPSENAAHARGGVCAPNPKPQTPNPNITPNLGMSIGGRRAGNSPRKLCNSRCPPRQTPRVERIKAKVEPLLTLGNSGEPRLLAVRESHLQAGGVGHGRALQVYLAHKKRPSP